MSCALALLAALCAAALAQAAPQQAATATSPFYTAMVNLSSVPTYRALMAPSNSSGPVRRAAGYPASPADSRPALQRDFGAATAAGGGGGSGGGLQGPSDLPTLPEVGRRLLQAGAGTSANDDGSGEGDDGAATAQAPVLSAAALEAAAAAGGACMAGAACFAPRDGFAGVDAPPAGAMGLAVGRRHAVQTAGGVMSVFSLGPDGAKTSTLRTVPLAAFFAGVAASCTSVDDGAAMYDKHADRFVVAASCGGFGRVLLAASATPSAGGTWYLFGLVADAAGTPLECASPAEQALADYPQLGYNSDALFVTYHSYCPSAPAAPRSSGAVLLALPKFKAYQGAPNMYAAVWTSAEVAAAAGPGGLPGGAAAVRQLQPVVPQAAGDVPDGMAYFVADHRPRSGAKRSRFVLIALANTGAMWGYAAGINGVPSPTLLSAVVPWGGMAPIYSDVMLRQPGGAVDLTPGGAAPAGFWSGGAALARGKLLLTTRSDVVEEGSAYSPRPGVIWAEVQPKITWAGSSGSANGMAFTVAASACADVVASGMAATFDWSEDYSSTWGSQFARNWSMSLSLLKSAAAIRPRPRHAARSALAPAAALGVASVVLDRAARLTAGAEVTPAANFLAMGFPRAAGWGSGLLGGVGSVFTGGPMGAALYRGRGGACGCGTTCGFGELQTYNYVYNFDDYCDAGYNQWGPATPNSMWGSTYNGAYCTGNAAFGLVGNSQFDQCGRWCSVYCSGAAYGAVSGYTYPRYGFFGATNYYPSFTYASIPDRAADNAAAAVAAAAPSAAAVLDGAAAAAAPAPPGPTKPMQASACAVAATLSATVVRSGTVDASAAAAAAAAGSPEPIGLAFPAVAVALNGAAAVAFVFSGPGAGAYPGVGAAYIDAATRGAVPMAVLQRASAPVVPSAAGGVPTWGDLSAADTHPDTGSVYVAVRRGGETRTQRGHIATWIGVLAQVDGGAARRRSA